MSTRPGKAVEVNQAIFVRSRVFIPDLIEYSALIELREITLEVELRHILYVGGIFGSPTVCCIKSLLSPRFSFGSMCRDQTNSTSNDARRPCRWLFGILEDRCVAPTVALAAKS
jgi:hypothetical protein